MTVTRISADGPDLALFRIARKLRLRYSQAFVVQAVSAHPRPSSLLALVDVANTMGIKTTPVRADATGLTSLRLPAVVHVSDVSGEEGFGVLEATSDDGVEIWDSLNGRRRIAREDFLAHWSGVAVIVEAAAEPGATEHRYRRQRFLEVVGGGASTPAVADGRSAPYLRAAFSLLVGVLVAAGLVVTPLADRGAAVALVVCAVAGVAVTVVMAASIGDRDNAFASRVCRRGKLVDCHSVLTSRYSRVFGLPLSDIGLAFYTAILLLVATNGWTQSDDVWRVCTLAFTATIPAAALLVAAQISMRQFCTLCLATHLINVAATVIGWWFLWRPGRGLDALLLATLFVLLFGFVLFVVIPYVRRSHSLVMISDRHRKMAASPFGTLAQVRAEPATEVRGPDHAVPVGDPQGAHEIVLFVHPGCGKCLPVLRELLAVSSVVPMRVFVGVAPKDPVESDRRACSVLAAAWMATTSDRIVDAYVAAKQNLPRLSGTDGAAVLAAELSVDPAAIESRIGAARPLVDLAERVVDRYADGTPAIFFDSRPYPAPLAHLAFLIQHHPELLEAL